MTHHRANWVTLGLGESAGQGKLLVLEQLINHWRMLMGFAAMLFDMDGVLIDTRHSVTVFWEDLARKHDVQLTEAIFAHHIYGTPAMHTLAMCFPKLSADECQAVLVDLKRYENGLTYTDVKGVITFLRALKQYGVATALVTSAEPRKVEKVVEQLAIDGLFSAVITADDVKQGKPNPQCYLLAAEKLGQSPDKCIVFEDAISGVKAGVAAGMLCVGIQQNAGVTALLEVGAKYVVPDFSAIRLDASRPEQLRLVVDGQHELMLEASSAGS